MVVDEETEVRRARRSWPVQYKLDILAEIDEAKARGEPGAVGAICRREGLYSSLITRTAEELIEAQGKALALLQRFARKSAMPQRPSGQNG